MGRRTNDYDSKIKPNLKKIKHWLSEGYSHKQIYEMLGISYTTFYKYQNPANKKIYKSEYAEVLKTSKDTLQIKLEEALYKEATGYEYEETHVEVETDETSKDKKVKKKQKKITKFARPNSNLLIFVLCNKFPEKWRRVDKDVVEALEAGNINLNITDKHIKDAFKALYPAINDKNDKKEDSNDKNKNKAQKEQ